MKALSDWKRTIGQDFVLTDPSVISGYSRATFATSQEVSAVLLPALTSEVQACVRIASEHGIPLYPNSQGMNCGYGSRVPVRSGNVVLDLKRMNRIHTHDEKLAYAIIEPGVTQLQLNSYLKSKKSRLWMDPVRSSPNCSVVANILERGHGMTPVCDRIAQGSDYEVVLGTGEVIETGQGRWPNARAKNLDRWGIGPSLDGLFSQSNFGVVTRMTAWLMPAAEHVEGVFFTLPSDERLAECLDLMLPLRQDGTLRMGPCFISEIRLIQNFVRYPWDEMEGKVPLSPALTAALMRKFGIKPWNGFVGIFGTREQVAVNRDRVIAALQGRVDDLKYFDQSFLAKPETELDAFGRFVRANLQTMGGEVVPMASWPYWRKRTPSTNDLIGDLCGLLWCPALSPFNGQDVLEAVKIYREVLVQFGFEPQLSMSNVRERTIEFNVPIVYDRETVGEDEKALSCSNALYARLTSAGFYPHRLGIQSMSVLEKTVSGHARTLNDLKAIFDPQGVIAPGRYLASPC